MREYDIIIIGAGPGGYHAAALAAERGKSVLLIEKEQLGGTCLNWGCIPTKTLLHIAKHYSYSKDLQTMGLQGDLRYQHTDALQWKNSVIDTLQKGINSLLKTRKVSVVQGEAKILSLQASSKTITIVGKENEVFSAFSLIIACGVESYIPLIPGIESAKPLTSRELLTLCRIPERLAVLGGGVIGTEFATIFAQLGTKVQVFEALPEILPMLDRESAKQLRTILAKEYSIEFFCNSKVEKIEKDYLHYIVQAQEGEQQSKPFDILLVSTGRKSNLQAFSDMGINTTATGIAVNEQMQTNIPKVYAIGDVVGSYQLAHTAYRMAEVAVNAITRSTSFASRMRYNAAPMVVYTNPELASCGMSEAEARQYTEERGQSSISASLPITTSGRVIAEHGAKPQGYCKIIVNKTTAKILGIHIVAPMASEVISAAAVIVEAELGVQELSEIIFPHPSVGEILHNVSLLLLKKLEAENLK